MATSGSVWAIDIGQCALKALKCRPHDDPKKIVAEAFDYIEYPKILSQPDSDPDELIGEALGQFLSRNSVKNDLVAISVPGVAGLMKFIPLPPVESSKIKAMVQYEQKQHIPFDPKAIVLRWQAMAGGKEEAGVALETEVGLFAIKRDTESRAARRSRTWGSTSTWCSWRRWPCTTSSSSTSCATCRRPRSTIPRTRPSRSPSSPWAPTRPTCCRPTATRCCTAACRSAATTSPRP